jgi:Flp pilus assembly protein TadD
VFDLVARHVTEHPQYLRCMGYLHLREERWDDAETAFVRAAEMPDAAEPDARLALDRARIALKRERFDDAIARARLGLATPNIWYSTRDELRDTLERAFIASKRPDDAIAVLDQRATERAFSLDLHHRLAREHVARNDLGKAGAALERAARMSNVLGQPQPFEQRVPASFDPIIAELRAAGRYVDADALAARATLILDAN